MQRFSNSHLGLFENDQFCRSFCEVNGPMFGLEKEKNKPFEFDLEKELKSNKRKKEVLQICEDKSQQLKQALRQGEASDNFDQCGIIMQGYAALTKVVQKAAD